MPIAWEYVLLPGIQAQFMPRPLAAWHSVLFGYTNQKLGPTHRINNPSLATLIAIGSLCSSIHHLGGAFKYEEIKDIIRPWTSKRMYKRNTSILHLPDLAALLGWMELIYLMSRRHQAIAAESKETPAVSVRINLVQTTATASPTPNTFLPSSPAAGGLAARGVNDQPVVPQLVDQTEDEQHSIYALHSHWL